MDNDQILWKGLRQGDKEMLLALYKKYYHSLLFIGLKEIKDAQLVKDTIQQLFLNLWEKRSSIEEARNIRSYIITSFLRKLNYDWKRSGKTGSLQVVWNNFSEDPQPNPEEGLVRKDEQNQLFKLLMQHINELPNRQKELIVLKFYEGLSYDEIVQKTGLSHRTVYNKIHEGLKKLKLDLATTQHTHSSALSSLITFLAASVIFAAH
jgi:RNA polymerase sigma-70 factor (ECF subfamily)